MTEVFEGDQESNALRVYEVGYLLLPSVPEEHIPESVLRVKDAITKGNGAILSEEAPLMRPLAYEMVKSVGTKNERFDTAYFGWVKFETTPSGAVEVKKVLDSMETVLRFILIKTTRETPVVVRPALDGEEGEQAPEAPPLSPKVAEVSIDKSIDELVIE